jgi:hypothetical protein
MKWSIFLKWWQKKGDLGFGGLRYEYNFFLNGDKKGI